MGEEVWYTGDGTYVGLTFVSHLTPISGQRLL
jgi:hypothetical protein